MTVPHHISAADRAAIVAAARAWLGTPYQHQGRAKAAGVDCAGLIVGVARDLQLGTGLDIAVYGRNPESDKLRLALAQEAHAVADHSPWLAGQICLIRFALAPQHLGILAGEGGIDSPNLTLIHAFSTAGQVVEHRLAEVWRARVVARYEFPEKIMTKKMNKEM